MKKIFMTTFFVVLMVTGIVLFVRIIKHILGEEYSIVFSILLSFNPFIILFSVNGLETSLLIFFIAILFTFHMDSDHKKLNNYCCVFDRYTISGTSSSGSSSSTGL